MRLLLCILPLFFVGAGAAWAASAASAPPSEETAAGDATESGTAEDPGFERYKTIMDRMPFGREPSGFNPDAPPGTAPAGGGRGGAGAAEEEAARTEEERRLLSAVRVSAINVTPSGRIAVGFTDSSVQPAVNYYLKVGESRDGWLVRDADADELKATLVKGEVEVELGLGQGQDGGKAGKSAGGGAPPLPPAGRRLLSQRPLASSRPQPASADVGNALARLKDRRAQRAREAEAEKARRAAAEEAAKQAAAEKEAEEARVREQAAAEREQARMALQQIQEELRKQRDERERQKHEAEAQEETPSSEGQEE